MWLSGGKRAAIVMNDYFLFVNALEAVLFQSISYTGENRRYLYTNLPKPIGLSVFGSQLYWADANLKKVSQPNSSFIMEILSFLSI